MSFHKIKSVKSLENKIIEVIFIDGSIKKYDIKPLIDKYEIFKELKSEKFFNKARVDIGGYAIVWNENIDLSSEEIWQNGK